LNIRGARGRRAEQNVFFLAVMKLDVTVDYLTNLLALISGKIFFPWILKIPCHQIEFSLFVVIPTQYLRILPRADRIQARQF